jgi:hypothetical protein
MPTYFIWLGTGTGSVEVGDKYQGRKKYGDFVTSRGAIGFRTRTLLEGVL